jgi:hypothetical protein
MKGKAPIIWAFFVLAAFTGLVVIGILLGSLGGDNRGGDVPAIRARLNQLPDVRVIDVVGWDELWPFFGPEDIRATLKVGENGTLVLRDLTLADFNGKGSFWIDRIGQWAPKITRLDDRGNAILSNGCYECAKTNPGAAFLELVPFGLGRTPADIVANYSPLHHMLDGWPDEPTTVASRDGRGRLRYWRDRVAD